MITSLSTASLTIITPQSRPLPIPGLIRTHRLPSFPPTQAAIMEIKIQCDCGQKFKFDVEPINGQIPFAVKCPVCGFDGTPRANVLLQQLLASAPVANAPAPLSIVASAPAPAYIPPPAPMRPAGLSINRPPSPQAVPASEDEEDIQGKETEDDNSEGGVREVKLGWKMWGVIILLIGLAIGGSYIKSARKSLVGDVLDWGWNKITGAGSQTTTHGDAVDYKELDKIAEEEIKGDDATEARAWLKVPANAIFEGDREEIVALMESFYKAGCPKVYITGIEKLGGANVSASMVVVLPIEPSQRQSAFKVEKEFSEKHGESGDQDKGQKYISLSFD